MFLEIFLGYNGQHKSVMHRYFQMNKWVCLVEYSVVEYIKVLLPKGERKLSLWKKSSSTDLVKAHGHIHMNESLEN